MSIVRSARSFDIGQYSAKVVHSTLCVSIRRDTIEAVKKMALSETIVCGGPNRWVISRSTNLATKSAVEVLMAHKIRQKVRISTEMRRQPSLSDLGGNGHARSIKKVWERPVRVMRREVQSVGIGEACWHPTSILTSQYT